MNQVTATNDPATAPAKGKSRNEAPPNGLLGVAEYARHSGIHRSTVSRQVKAGIIPNHAPPGARPMIDPVEADAARVAGLDHGKRRTRVKAPDNLPAVAPAASPPAGPTFNEARIKREEAQAGLAELNLEERAGRLVNRAEVEHAAFDAGKILRERILGVPLRLAGELVTMVRGGGGDREVAGLIGERLRDALKDVVTTIAPAETELR